MAHWQSKTWESFKHDYLQSFPHCESAYHNLFGSAARASELHVINANGSLSDPRNIFALSKACSMGLRRNSRRIDRLSTNDGPPDGGYLGDVPYSPLRMDDFLRKQKPVLEERQPHRAMGT